MCGVSLNQPPISPGSGIVSAPWIAGPHEATPGSVVVSFTDFRASSEEQQQQVFDTGLILRKNWPVMQGAVGLWMWAKPEELRGGSFSVWTSRADLQRFIRWPVHVAIMQEWKDRIGVVADSWETERFDAGEAWARAEAQIRQPRADLAALVGGELP